MKWKKLILNSSLEEPRQTYECNDQNEPRNSSNAIPSDEHVILGTVLKDAEHQFVQLGMATHINHNNEFFSFIYYFKSLFIVAV